MIEYLSLDCDNSEDEGYSFSEKKPDRNSFVILNDEKTKSFWDGSIKSEKSRLSENLQHLRRRNDLESRL